MSKGGIIIENKVSKIKELINSEDNYILKEILNNVLNLNIDEIRYDKNIKLSNISEYEFELIKVKAKIKNEEEVEMYLKLIKNTRIKESIFCYWCSIYEEELMKSEELDNMDLIFNKVLISELDNCKYQKRIFLTIENNRTHILGMGTEVNFVEILEYIKNFANEKNEYEKLYKYIEKESDDVLLVGVKINRSKNDNINKKI